MRSKRQGSKDLIHCRLMIDDCRFADCASNTFDFPRKFVRTKAQVLVQSKIYNHQSRMLFLRDSRRDEVIKSAADFRNLHDLHHGWLHL